MATATIEEVQANLPALLASLLPGEELVTTRQNQPVARLVAERARPPGKTRKFGGGKGKLTFVEEDDEHLDDVREYMW
jgi:antitoxin (DNA-binding transcriptional repressor) of toxin-antitoxin stability system